MVDLRLALKRTILGIRCLESMQVITVNCGCQEIRDTKAPAPSSPVVMAKIHASRFFYFWSRFGIWWKTRYYTPFSLFDTRDGLFHALRHDTWMFHGECSCVTFCHCVLKESHVQYYLLEYFTIVLPVIYPDTCLHLSWWAVVNPSFKMELWCTQGPTERVYRHVPVLPALRCHSYWWCMYQ